MVGLNVMVISNVFSGSLFVFICMGISNNLFGVILGWGKSFIWFKFILFIVGDRLYVMFMLSLIFDVSVFVVIVIKVLWLSCSVMMFVVLILAMVSLLLLKVSSFLMANVFFMMDELESVVDIWVWNVVTFFMLFSVLGNVVVSDVIWMGVLIISRM